jgi:hypothetical protein
LAKPKSLFIAADGPRIDKVGDIRLCAEARDVIKKINWDCDVHTLYHDQNLGCKIAMSSAINWFFNHVEAGIILEDDCAPDISFFNYCEELLEKYKNDTLIGIISGDLFLRDRDIQYSYYFSSFPHMWGWATWRRTWKNYDSSIKDWPQFRNLDWLTEKTGSEYYARIWLNIFESVYQQQIDTWDYQVVFMLWAQSQLSIVPNRNLVSNLGFGSDSTHTQNASDRFSLIPTEKMIFPLVHPRLIFRDKEKDLLEALVIFGSPTTLSKKILIKLKSIVGKIN